MKYRQVKNSNESTSNKSKLYCNLCKLRKISNNTLTHCIQKILWFNYTL